MTPLRGTVGPLSTISTPLRGTDVTSSESVKTGFMSVETGTASFIVLAAIRPAPLGGLLSILVAGPLLQSSLRHLIWTWGAVVGLTVGNVVVVGADVDDAVCASCKY